MDLLNKKVLVCGMAKSGVSAAKFLKSKFANVIIQDIKKDFPDNILKELTELGINLFLGANPDKIISEQELIILSPGIPTDLPFLKKAKELNIPIWSEIELAYRFCPSQNIISITGTNGKTTTTSLVYEIVKSFCDNSVLVGNIGIPFTSKLYDITEDTLIVSELSSFQLENIEQFRPKVSAILNITPDHLDRHKTLENYICAKEQVFKNQLNSDYIVLNFDDEYCIKIKDKVNCTPIFFSRKTELENGVFIKYSKIFAKVNGLNNEVIDLKDIKILGDHNVENVLCAVAISIAINIPIQTIKNVISSFKGVVHRIEYVCTKNNVEFYNDSKATNPDAGIKGVLAMRRPTVLICGGYERPVDFNEWVKTFNGRVKFAVVIGQSADKIIETFINNDFHNFKKIETFESAINTAYEKSESGDCVLLSPACASYGMFNNFEERGDLFKKIILEQ